MINIKKQWSFVFPSLIVLIAMIQVGMVPGWASPHLARLQAPDSLIPVTSDEGSWMATIMAITEIFATPVAALSIEYLGRKKLIFISLIPYLLSWIVLAVATSVTTLMIGRGISGIGAAFMLSVAPIYLGEICTADTRGTISLCLIVFGNVGILWMYIVGIHPELWFSSVLAILPLLFVLLLYKFLPESPYFLIKQHRQQEAEQALKKLRNQEHVQEEIKRINDVVFEYSDVNPFKELISEPCHRRALIVCNGITTISQFTGGIALIMYTHLIFQRAGDISINMLSIIKGVLQFLTSVGAAYFVDSLGRKPLLIISCIGSAIFMACEGVYFYLLDYDYNVDNIWWLPVFALVMFNLSQNIGLSPIALAYFGELFHPKVKTLLVCISKAYLALSVVIVGKLFQILTDTFGNCVPFFLFAIVGLLGVPFVIFMVPETKGKSLEEIQYYFKNKTYEDNTKN